MQEQLRLLAYRSLARAWDELYAQNVVTVAFDAPQHPFFDVLLFLVVVVRHLCQNHRWPRPRTRAFVQHTLQACLSYLAEGLRVYIRDVYCQSHDVTRPPPAVTFPRAGVRTHSVMSLDAKWEVVDQARRSNQSVEQVLRIKADGDPAYKGSYKSCAMWQSKLNYLYFEKQACFKGVEHINLVSDPGTHDGREMLLSAAYSWQRDEATMARVQYLTPGKDVTHAEYDTLPDIVESLRAAGKLTRVPAFRQLQGVSHQTCLLTGRPLWEYAAPEGVYTRAPAAAGTWVRTIEPRGATDCAVWTDTTTGAQHEALPASVTIVPLVTLGYDQGGIGAAGAAFAELHMRILLFVIFDKIHRLLAAPPGGLHDRSIAPQAVTTVRSPRSQHRPRAVTTAAPPTAPDRPSALPHTRGHIRAPRAPRGSSGT